MDVIINESQLRFLIEGKRGKLGYTKDGLRELAKTYTDYGKFRTSEKSAYSAARRFGPCYDKNGIEVNCYITSKKENPDSVRNSLEFFNEITSHMEKTLLTKDKIRDIAKTYDNYAEFLRKERGAYEAARRFGPCYDKNGIEVNCYITSKKENPDSVRNSLEFFNEITSHMEKSSLTKDKIRDIAKKYDYYTEFRTKEGSSYFAARRFGPCYDGKGNKVDCYYIKSGNWNKSPGVHNTLEFFNDITSHMIRTDFGPKMVYSYTFFDDTKKVVGVYVGITNDEERRKGEHLTGESTFTDKEVKSAVSKFKKENPLFRVKYKSLTEYIPFVDAQVKEEEYVNNAKSNGYNILNIAKTGGGGTNFGFPDKYLIDKVNDWIKNKKDKGEEPLLKDFRNEYISIYNNIRGRMQKGNDKIYDETLGKLIKSSKTDEELIEIAMSCDSSSDFREKYQNTFYNRASDRGLLPQIKQMFADGLNTPDQTTPETTPSV